MVNSELTRGRTDPSRLPPTTPTTLAVLSIPGSTRRLSEGVALKASVIARLLGMRLLTLDATVLVAPAEITATTTVPSSSPPPSLPLPPALPHRPAGRSRPVGDGLREAARDIEAGAASLAAARAGAPPH